MNVKRETGNGEKKKKKGRQRVHQNAKCTKLVYCNKLYGVNFLFSVKLCGSMIIYALV